MKRRDKDLSNSDLGQWVHDNLPMTMFFIDLDAVIYKRATKILRIVEQKQPGQALKPSQQAILSFLTSGVDALIESGDIHPRSGVFVLWGVPPYKECLIQRFGETQKHKLTHGQFIRFVSGEL